MDSETLAHLKANLEWLHDTTEAMLGKLLLVGEAATKYDTVDASFTLTAKAIVKDWQALAVRQAETAS